MTLVLLAFCNLHNWCSSWGDLRWKHRTIRPIAGYFSLRIAGVRLCATIHNVSPFITNSLVLFHVLYLQWEFIFCWKESEAPRAYAAEQNISSEVNHAILVPLGPRRWTAKHSLWEHQQVWSTVAEQHLPTLCTPLSFLSGCTFQCEARISEKS